VRITPPQYNAPGPGSIPKYKSPGGLIDIVPAAFIPEVTTDGQLKFDLKYVVIILPGNSATPHQSSYTVEEDWETVSESFGSSLTALPTHSALFTHTALLLYIPPNTSLYVTSLPHFKETELNNDLYSASSSAQRPHSRNITFQQLYLHRTDACTQQSPAPITRIMSSSTPCLQHNSSLYTDSGTETPTLSNIESRVADHIRGIREAADAEVEEVTEDLGINTACTTAEMRNVAKIAHFHSTNTVVRTLTHELADGHETVELLNASHLQRRLAYDASERTADDLNQQLHAQAQELEASRRNAENLAQRVAVLGAANGKQKENLEAVDSTAEDLTQQLRAKARDLEALSSSAQTLQQSYDKHQKGYRVLHGHLSEATEALQASTRYTVALEERIRGADENLEAFRRNIESLTHQVEAQKTKLEASTPRKRRCRTASRDKFELSVLHAHGALYHRACAQ
jgi:predicted  nucleic acid-binding Zn-ribbon protein